jgi:hypothetical protein
VHLTRSVCQQEEKLSKTCTDNRNSPTDSTTVQDKEEYFLYSQNKLVCPDSSPLITKLPETYSLQNNDMHLPQAEYPV